MTGTFLLPTQSRSVHILQASQLEGGFFPLTSSPCSPDALSNSLRVANSKNPNNPLRPTISRATLDEMSFLSWRERQAANRANTTVLLKAENPEVPQSEPSPLSRPQWRLILSGRLCSAENPPRSWPLLPLCPRSPKKPDRAISRPTSSYTLLADDECSLSPFGKREYLLAQMRQKYELSNYLFKQVRLSHILLTKYMRIC